MQSFKAYLSIILLQPCLFSFSLSFSPPHFLICTILWLHLELILLFPYSYFVCQTSIKFKLPLVKPWTAIQLSLMKYMTLLESGLNHSLISWIDGFTRHQSSFQAMSNHLFTHVYMCITHKHSISTAWGISTNYVHHLSVQHFTAQKNKKAWCSSKLNSKCLDQELSQPACKCSGVTRVQFSGGH